ncbi:MAG: hypothetical protein QOH20_998 [Mycobacterium sp.]|jgi:hypothetical protein|nr:hypothetical protein [Mycobacterium sp.]
MGNEVADDNSATSRVARRPDGFESVRAGCPKVELRGLEPLTPTLPGRADTLNRRFTGHEAPL